MKITTTSDFCPLKNKVYFSNNYNTKDCIAVIIPFYNEERNELYETLKSLYYTYKYLSHMKSGWERKKLQIFLIQDGWYKSSESMKEYLQELFPFKINNKIWSEYYEDFKTYDFKNGSKSYIFESNTPLCINKHLLPNIEIAKYLNITLMIKIDNRKKHNSHEWFIGRNGFAEVKKCKYIFCTDAFTLFHKSCLYHLIRHMDNNKKTAVCTGRQRVMTKKQQGTDESMFSLSSILRNVQLFDFESSNALYNGAFSIVGFLPVVPGPCGLYRAEVLLKDEVRYWYFDIVNQEPSETGLVLGNLRIAEDRILSYSVILRGQEEYNMIFVPQSVFYFEAELDLQKFMLQRRRWINGSVAGYIYLLYTNIEHIKKWNTNIFRKLYILLLLIFQALTYFIVALGPSFSLSIFLHSLGYLLQFSELQYVTIEVLTYLLTLFMSLLYIFHFFIHNKNKFNTTIIYLLLIFSMITSCIAGLSLFMNILMNYNYFIDLVFQSYFYFIISIIILSVMILPFLNAILISGRLHSFYYMIKSFFSYFLFSHMMISAFGSYSYARVWDLTWGNRPTSDTNMTMTKEEMDIMQENFKEKSRLIVVYIILLNFIVFCIPSEAKFGIVCVFFFIAFIQLMMSFLYLVLNIPTKIKYMIKYMKKDISLFELIQNDRKQTKETILDLSNEELIIEDETVLDITETKKEYNFGNLSHIDIVSNTTVK